MRWLSTLTAATALISVVSGATFPPCTKIKVRKDWRALTKPEKANWIAAVNCLNKLPANPNIDLRLPQGTKDYPAYNKSGTFYGDFVYVHMDISNDVHGTPYFFPWHRWYVQVYEDALVKYCNLTTPSPYWDWSKETDVQKSAMFSDPDPESGLGGWGDPKDDEQVPDGGFRNFGLSYPVWHRLRRTFKNMGRPGELVPKNFAPATIKNMTTSNIGNFSAFQSSIENGPHGTGHGTVGGDLAGACPASAVGAKPGGCGGPFWSANEPLFWLHHGMVDKVWWDWQMFNTSRNLLAFGGPRGRASANMTFTLDSVMPTGNLGPAVTVRDVMNTTSGFQCFVYE